MSEEEIKKQKEIEIKANALRERLLVKKNPQPLTAMVTPKASDAVVTPSPQPLLPLRVPSPPPVPKFTPQVKEVKQEVSAKKQNDLIESQSTSTTKLNSANQEVKIDDDSPLKKSVPVVKDSKPTAAISVNLNDGKIIEKESKPEMKKDLKQSKLSDGISGTEVRGSEIANKEKKSTGEDMKKDAVESKQAKEKEEEAKPASKISHSTTKNALEDGNKGVITSLKETLAAAAAKSSLANKELKNSLATTNQVKALSNDNGGVAKPTKTQKEKVEQKKVANIEKSQIIESNVSKVSNSSPKNMSGKKTLSKANAVDIEEDDMEEGYSLQETLKALSKDSSQSEVLSPESKLVNLKQQHSVVNVVTEVIKPVEPVRDKVSKPSSLLETLRELQEPEEKNSTSFEIEQSVTPDIAKTESRQEVKSVGEDETTQSVKANDITDSQVARLVVEAITSQVAKVLSNQVAEKSSSISRAEKPNTLVEEVVKNLTAGVEKLVSKRSPDISLEGGENILRPDVLIPIKKQQIAEDPIQVVLEETQPTIRNEKSLEKSLTDQNKGNQNQGKTTLEKDDMTKFETPAVKTNVIESEQEASICAEEKIQNTMAQILNEENKKIDESKTNSEKVVTNDPVKIQEKSPLQVEHPVTPLETPIQSQVDDTINAIDPFDLGTKFTNNFNMFRSTVVGISSAVDNESFLTNALKNFSSSRLFDSDDVESSIEVREETVLSSNVEETNQIKKGPRRSSKHKRKKNKRDNPDDGADNDQPLSKSELPVVPSPSPRKKVKITVYEESADEIDDVTDMTKTKPKGAKRGPKPGSSRLRKGPKHLKEASLSEEAAADDYDSDSGPLIIEAGKSKSIDHCPRCNAGLNALSGGYTINVATLEVTVTCVSCRRLILIKNSFSDLKAFEP
jgi:hypothetical protein